MTPENENVMKSFVLSFKSDIDNIIKIDKFDEIDKFVKSLKISTENRQYRQNQILQCEQIDKNYKIDHYRQT